MTVMKKRAPKISPFAQMLRDKREKLAPDVPLRDFCARRGFDAPMISDMEADRRTAPGTYALLYKLASGYGHAPDDRWTKQLLDAALGKAPAPSPAKSPATARRPKAAPARSRAARGSKAARRPSTSGTRTGHAGASRTRG